MCHIKRRDFLGLLGVGATGIGVSGLADEAQKAPTAAGAAKTEKTRQVFLSGREDGRFVQTAGFMHAYLKNLRPKLEFDPQMKAEDFPAWRNAVGEKVLELMCFPDVPQPPPPKRLWTKQREGYQLQKWEAYPEPLSVVPFLVLVPDGVSQSSPAPAVLCFPGSSSSTESLAGEPELGQTETRSDSKWLSNRMAWHYTQRGFVSVAVENPATAETGSPLCARSRLSLSGIWMGRHYEGISVFQKACILQWLSQQPYVDRRRIAASGHSLGSNPADILGILYPDLVKAVVHNDFVCNWHERIIAMNFDPDPAWHIVPGIFQWFDYPDLEASLAPRPLLFTEGGRANQIDRIRGAYNLLGGGDKITVFHYEKYATPDLRPLDHKELPEGLSITEYFRYANVDAAKHRFRYERAVPWLAKVLAV